MLNTKGCPLKEERYHLFSAQEAGNDLINSLVTSELSLSLDQTRFSHVLMLVSVTHSRLLSGALFLSQWDPPLWEMSHVLRKWEQRWLIAW